MFQENLSPPFSEKKVRFSKMSAPKNKRILQARTTQSTPLPLWNFEPHIYLILYT